MDPIPAELSPCTEHFTRFLVYPGVVRFHLLNPEGPVVLLELVSRHVTPLSRPGETPSTSQIKRISKPLLLPPLTPTSQVPELRIYFLSSVTTSVRPPGLKTCRRRRDTKSF